MKVYGMYNNLLSLGPHRSNKFISWLLVISPQPKTINFDFEWTVGIFVILASDLARIDW